MIAESDIVTKVLETVKKKGASQAELVYAEGSGIAVSCRNSAVDTVENNQDRSLTVTVYKGLAKGSASTAVLDAESIDLTIEKALAIAALTEEDEFAGLAEAELLATEFKDLQCYFDNQRDTEQLIDMGLQAANAAVEKAAAKGEQLQVDEADVELGEGRSIYANSNGFYGEKRGSNASISVVGIAERDGVMERDYAWDAVRDVNLLASPQAIGQQAAERTLSRLGARKIKSCKARVLFEASVAKSLVGHFLSAISGGALYQEASFLKDDLHQQLFPTWFELFEDPFVAGGFASRNFDANGVQTRQRKIVEQGCLEGFLLSVYSARRLGLKTTGNAGGSHNLSVLAPSESDLIAKMDKGLYVTSLMGQGVNAVTGDYSRGASGFWVENGQIQFPVNELTIAGHLKDMYRGLLAVGDDLDTRSKITTGSWLIDEMTIAGD